MGQKPKPVTRQELGKLAVTDLDAFTALRFLRHRETVPALPELEGKGEEALPGTVGALGDLFHALWSPEASVKEEVPPDRQYWQKLIGQTLQSAAFQELHASTESKELQSVLGTIAMGESLVAAVPKKDQEQQKELSKQQAEAEQKEQEAQQAQAEAEAAEQLASAAAEAMADRQAGQAQSGGQSRGRGKPSGMSQAEAQAIANELAKQASQAKAKAQATAQQAQAAKAKAEALAEKLLGQPGTQAAEDKLRELTRIGLAAVKKAQTKVSEVSDTIESWGLDPAELTQQGIPESLALLERMRKNEHFKKFAEMLGRVRKIAARKAKQKIAGEGVRVTTVETGRDLKRAQKSELIALTHPALRHNALVRWARGELRLTGQKAKQKLGHGPVVVCEDASGSMDGEKQQWCKAAVLSLAHYAKLLHRSFGWIMFDASVHQAEVYPQGVVSALQMLTIAESRAGGGTDFEKPLRKAMEMIQKEALKKADICFITDGECALGEGFLREFAAAKKALEFNVITILCDVGSSADATVKKFSDRIEHVSKFTAETADAKLFAHL